MGVSVGRLREDSFFDYKFVGLSHNTLRGAAGGAVLIAELLFRKDTLHNGKKVLPHPHPPRRDNCRNG